jgi:ectoine hydroxylase-related dioxygenase (phytanoyl-CoA dioxygenase family)
MDYSSISSVMCNHKKTMTSLYNTKSALQALGVTDTTLTSEEKDFLDQNGYLVLPDILNSSEIEALRARLAELLAIEKENAGLEVHQETGTARLANLVDKGKVFEVCFTHPRVLAALAHVLENDMKLSALNSRAALPGQGLQALHVDWHEPVTPGHYQVCNSIWLLDDFTKENGATRLVAKSHRLGKMPSQVMSDPTSPHPDEQLLIAPAGTVVIFNSHTWHGGTVNRTAKPRRAAHSYWCRRDQKQLLDQSRYVLSPETQAGFSAPVKYLLDVEDSI